MDESGHDSGNTENLPSTWVSVTLDENNSADHGTVERRHPTLNLTSGLGAFPASSINDQANRAGSTVSADLILKDVLPLGVAKECFAYFMDHLNQYLHCVLDSQDTLESARARSPLLLAAVCTVACLCSNSSFYRSCHAQLKSEVSEIFFTQDHSYDDVRALCIAAFWLDDVAPTISAVGKLGIATVNLI